MVDTHHQISSLFNLVNVPSAVWIDEKGYVRRVDEGTYATTHKMGDFEFGRADYAPLVEQWVKEGEKCPHLKAPVDVGIVAKTLEQAKAEPAFRLGVYFQTQGDEAKANEYWAQAQAMNPDSWNYHRQDWSFTPEEASGNWQKKVETMGEKPYYKPIEDLDKTL